MFSPASRAFAPGPEARPPTPLLKRDVKGPSAAHQIHESTEFLIETAQASGNEVQEHIRNILAGMKKPEEVQAEPLVGRAEELQPKKEEFEELGDRITSLQKELKGESDIYRIHELSEQVLACIRAFKILSPQAKLKNDDKQLEANIKAFRVSYKKKDDLSSDLTSNLTSIIKRVDKVSDKFKDHAEGLKRRALRLQTAVQQSPSIEILKSITSLEGELDTTIEDQDIVNNPRWIIDNFPHFQKKAHFALGDFNNRLLDAPFPTSTVCRVHFVKEFNKQKNIIQDFLRDKPSDLKKAKQFAQALADLDKLYIELGVVMEDYDDATRFFAEANSDLAKLKGSLDKISLKTHSEKFDKLAKKQQIIRDSMDKAVTASDFKNIINLCEKHKIEILALKEEYERYFTVQQHSKKEYESYFAAPPTVPPTVVSHPAVQPSSEDKLKILQNPPDALKKLEKAQLKLEGLELPEPCKTRFKYGFIAQKKIIENLCKKTLSSEDSKKFAQAIEILDMLYNELDIVIESYAKATKLLDESRETLEHLKNFSHLDRSKYNELDERRKTISKNIDGAKTASDFPKIILDCEALQREIAALTGVPVIHNEIYRQEQRIVKQIEAVKAEARNATPRTQPSLIQVSKVMVSFIERGKTDIDAAAELSDWAVCGESLTALKKKLDVMERWSFVEKRYYTALHGKTKRLNQLQDFKLEKNREFRSMQRSKEYTEKVKSDTLGQIDQAEQEEVEIVKDIVNFKLCDAIKEKLLNELYQKLEKAKTEAEFDAAWEEYLSKVEELTEDGIGGVDPSVPKPVTYKFPSNSQS